MQAGSGNAKAASVDFDAFLLRLQSEPPCAPHESGAISATDGVSLAYDLHLSSGHNSDILIFYHGGGAHRRAGYDRLAGQIARTSALSVCTPDLRGHGDSGGPRGHCPSPQAMWADLDEMIAQMRGRFPYARLFVGGHSSGAGFVLNALGGSARRRDIAGLMFLAPEFGYRAGLHRSYSSFARIKVWPFLLNIFSGGFLAGDWPAVYFDSAGAKPSSGLVDRYSVNMANAVTPLQPATQLSGVDRPLWIFYAERDELIDPKKLGKFVRRNKPPFCAMESIDTTHLGIILDAAPAIVRVHQLLRAKG
jgi:pimeloyl-ACP methyl ester carboxylesterase